MADTHKAYPASDLDDPKKMLAQLGSFWESLFSSKDQLRDYVNAVTFCANENYKHALQALDATSRKTVPVFDKKTIAPVVLKKSELNSVATNIQKFNNTTAKFDDGALAFDTIFTASEFAFPLPKNLVSVNQLLDALEPTHAWIKNTDFVIDTDRGAIVFAKNPFESGAQIDYATGDPTMYLWGVPAEFDEKYIFEQFAYVTNLRLRSSENYKQLVDAILTGIVNGGAAAETLDKAIIAICDIPLVKTAEELVEHVFHDGHGLCIATDKNTYRFSGANRPIVSVGQKVFGGQALVDGLIISEFAPPNNFKKLADNLPLYQQANNAYLSTQGFDYVETQGEEQIILNTEETCPYRPKDLQAVAVGPGLLSACFFGELVFENKDVPLRVNTAHPTGYTYASFQLNGHPADVAKFFDEIHARGIARRRPCEKDCCAGPAPKPIKFTNLNDASRLVVSVAATQTITGTATPGAIIELFADHDKNSETDPLSVGSAVVDFCGNWSVHTTTPLAVGVHKFNAIQSFPPGLPTTLARVLDNRKYGETEPTELNLPKTINPMQFLITNVLRNNVFIARIRVAGLGQNHLGLYNIRQLKQLLPPQTALIVVFEFDPPDENIDATKNIAETTSYFTGAEPAIDEINTNNVNDLGARIFTVSGTCQ